MNDSDFHYQLPPGLKAGTLVKLLSFDHGYWTVEADGQRFEKIFMVRIESGWEYELQGRWLDEKDPRVMAFSQTKAQPSRQPAMGKSNSLREPG